jgi:hypothetical protein
MGCVGRSGGGDSVDEEEEEEHASEAADVSVVGDEDEDEVG